MAMILTSPTALSATALLTASGTAMYTTKIIPEMRKELDDMKASVSVSASASAAAAAAASRAASSFESLVKSLPASRTVAAEMDSEERERAITVSVSKALAPVNASFAKLTATHDALSAAIDDVYSRLESVDDRFNLTQQRISRLESIINSLIQAIEPGQKVGIRKRIATTTLVDDASTKASGGASQAPAEFSVVQD
jgi:tetrahydromethanopterin S-methyltransferase subunit B